MNQQYLQCHPKNGFDNCDKNCLNSECFKENGSCVACVQGFYYADCSEECHTNCRSNTTCHQVEGTCPDGCMTGYFGDKCTI
ncbi:multiple epidermal growth factor-like domains protein 10, partial [Biomphalaria glabrata]|uniref:EGF-like domain-containing protein n=1 Tax=Biomphalaria glabrata TaxID=6526 RepID=A0A2C9LIK8_BIOGL